MECPINTPVGLDEDTGTIHNAYGEIEIRTVYDLRIIDEQQELLKYIVQAINSHEKLVREIEPVLADMNTIKNILQESSTHNDSASIVRPVDCKCGFCLMETMICRSHIRLEQALEAEQK